MSQLIRVVASLSLLTLVGAAGFYVIEGWSFFEALYMTVITLTTVGYEEIRPLSTAGRAFVMAYLVVGLGVFLYSATQVGEFIVRAQLRNWLSRRKMDTTLKSLKDHFIVCGFGRMGRRVCRQLAARDAPFVVVERDGDALEDCRDEKWPWLEGDATNDRTLETAGIHRARGLATLLGSDADNLFVVLSARLLAPDLQILARSTDEKGAAKMEKAGANRVVSLYTTGASKVTQLLVNPNVEEFLEFVADEGREMGLAEIHVTDKASFAGRKLSEVDFERRGITVVSIRRAAGEVLLPPSASTTIESGDSLVALGDDASIRKLLEEA